MSDLFEVPPPVGPQVEVWAGRALDMVLDYIVPAHLCPSGPPAPGSLALVPLGRDVLAGVIVGPGSQSVPADKLRAVEALSDLPPLSPSHLEMLRRAAAYTLIPRGQMARMAVPLAAALIPPKPVTLFAAVEGADALPLRWTPARRAVLAVAQEQGPMERSPLARAAGVGPAVVSGLIDAGALEPRPTVVDWQPPRPDPEARPVRLSADQARGADHLASDVEAQAFRPVLLDGVTGSGKTEVYFEALAQALRVGGQALVLLPEIALTPQWLTRFEQRFGCPPVSWHSGLTKAQRIAHYRAIASGRARVVVGARSALFLPLPRLALVIVDEEHDSTFKQEDGAHYHARDLAVLRASLVPCPVVLASATPSLESERNVRLGRYQRVPLPGRFGAAGLPQISAIDLRLTPPPRDGWLAPPLVTALRQTLAAGQQALVFLNRRGFAPLTLCRACGERIRCHQCSSWMVEHRLRRQLMCHTCGYRTPIPELCPSCNAPDSLVACGPGVERIEAELAAHLPDARRLILSSDFAPSAAQMHAMIDAVAQHQVDLVIGTQIIAKGHNFPNLTLVGVVDADLSLGGGDLRAAERTFQVLYQVAGRAGRGDAPGRVLIQTRQPEHPVMAALLSGDRESFYREELAQREAAGMPPYGRMVALICSAKDPAALDMATTHLARAAPSAPEVLVLGPAEPPLALVRGQHRRRFLVIAPRAIPVQSLVRDWLGRVRLPSSVRVSVDVDPVSFL